MPKLFISHSSADKQFVEKLVQDLAASDIAVWVDTREIKVGDDIFERLGEGLQESDYLAIVLTQKSVNSEWVKAELSTAFVRQMEEKRVVILPLLLEECDVPPLLKGRHHADFRKDYECGLQSLKSRFAHHGEEEQVKRKVLARLSSIPSAKLDPHTLADLAIRAGELDAAEQVMKAHEGSQPKCSHVPAMRAVIARRRFADSGRHVDFVAAIDYAHEAVMRNPHPENSSMIASLVAHVPKTREAAEVVLTHLRQCVSCDRNKGPVCANLCAVHYLKMIEQLPLNDKEIAEVCNVCCTLANSGDQYFVRHCLAPLVATCTHVAFKSEDHRQKASRMGCIYQAGSSRVGASREFGDAFLHLAWAAAISGHRGEASIWLGKYQLTVDEPVFVNNVSHHPPLASVEPTQCHSGL